MSDTPPPSALPATSLRLADETPLLLVWGGLGFSRRPVRELRELYALYQHDLAPFLQRCDAILHPLLVDDAGGDAEYGSGGLMQWMTAESKRSPTLSPAITMVTATVLQIARYVLLCKRLGKTPGEVARAASAFTGHSVGLVVAAAMAASDSWDSLYARTECIISSFYYSLRCTDEVWDRRNLVPPAAASQCMRRGEGSPSPMLSVTGPSKASLTRQMDLVNETLPDDRKLHLSLINDIDSHVAAGGPEGLVALGDRLRALDQGMAPGGTSCSLQFIPVPVPFHTPHLSKAMPAIARKTAQYIINRTDFLVPVWGLDSFLDAHQGEFDDNIAAPLANLSFARAVDWPAIMKPMTGRWQVLDLGPGGSSGIGAFINRMKSEPKTRVYAVLPQDLTRKTSLPLLCHISGDPNPQTYEHAVLEKRHVPRSQPPTRQLPSSKFTDLLGLPRVLVAGMTPTTCDVDLVAAIMKAGFYVEFATGGYFDAKALESAILSLARKIPHGRLITLNVIYANPQGLGWMIPQIAALVRQGCPIGGVTIGAGVPDVAVIAEWVKLLELSYIGFKPSSTATIRQVLEIARAHPTLPVILQWTGGRAGGHHSQEDFHQPILETYQAIREVNNVILVGGGGFGDADSSWPYISGDWSQALGRPPMPFDAILIGTCIMATREAKTSPSAKQAMVEAPGVHDEEWRGTLQGGAGGAISIISHLGEPMHVLATRGMLLWADLDKTLFHLPKEKMVAALESRRSSIIARLNSDHQNVWFGFDYGSMSPVDLEDMTYISVLRRLLDLVHPLRTGKWVHPSYQGVVDDWVMRILERFADAPDHLPMDPDPRQQLQSLASKYPDADHFLLTLEDAHYFIDLCRKRGRKPVPFIPVLDAEFPIWFKKDPLWQSENVDATFHGDVGRVCILAGPVALQHCLEADVPVARYLDGIVQGHLDKEKSLFVPSLPSPLYEVEELVHLTGRSHVTVEASELRLGQFAPGDVDNDLWLQLLGSKLGVWGRKLFGMKKLYAEGRAYHNPMRRIFSAQPGTVVRFFGPTNDGHTAAEIYVGGGQGLGGLADAQVSISGTTITAVLPNPYTSDGQTAKFELKFKYDESCLYAPVSEEQEHRLGRLLNFIGDVFFGSAGLAGAAIPPNTTQLAVKVNREHFWQWMSAVDGQGLDNELLCHVGKTGEIPMEYCTFLAMTLMWQLLLERGWDTAKLLHRRTTIEIKPDQRPLRLEDSLIVEWSLGSLHNGNSGLDAKLDMTLSRDGVAALGIEYVFAILDERIPEAECFGSLVTNTWTMHLSSHADAQVLLSKPWFQPRSEPGTFQPGQTLLFELGREAAARTPGTVWIQGGRGERTLCGRVDADASTVHGANVVVAFLNRRAERVDESAAPEGRSLRGRDGQALRIVVPRNSVAYCRATRDFNPNHTLPAFARYSGWRGPIVQGNQTAALLLRLIRREVPGASSSTIRRYDFDFRSVVYEGDELAVSLKSSTQRGRTLIRFTLQSEGSGEIVLAGIVELALPETTYLFTGQGSQFTGMGMELIDQSRPARQVWAEADEYFADEWGFSLSDIVRRNPKTLTINFSSRQGIRVRETYLEAQAMFRTCYPSDARELFPGLHAKSRAFAFHHEEGLLSMTQFAQPALLVLERAAFEHLRQRGRVPAGSRFAGHSLGEFAALGCMTAAMSPAAALKTVFVRGTLMQMAVPRDARGRSGFAMAAVDPARAHPRLDEARLRALVAAVAARSGLLLELVNLNVRGRQYVCSGDKRALDLLRRVTEGLRDAAPSDGDDDVAARGLELVHRHAPACLARAAADVVLERGRALIPLPGIDVPFHSSLMTAMARLFRQTLVGAVDKNLVRAEHLVGRWVPNVTGRLFSTDRAYVESVAQITGSPRLAELAAGLAV